MTSVLFPHPHSQLNKVKDHQGRIQNWTQGWVGKSALKKVSRGGGGGGGGGSEPLTLFLKKEK